VAWHVKPGQTIKAHVHPRGQDSWTILSGEGDYQTDSTGSVIRIYAGDIVIAHANQVHGVHNSGQEDLTFISVVTTAEAGYQLLT